MGDFKPRNACVRAYVMACCVPAVHPQMTPSPIQQLRGDLSDRIQIQAAADVDNGVQLIEVGSTGNERRTRVDDRREIAPWHPRSASRLVWSLAARTIGAALSDGSLGARNSGLQRSGPGTL